ncbi:MAG: DNA topoisomerase (ATP-hydrolyzing) subunit A [Dehalococcoidia bacterium]|nr:MAG: DNA topoisomerase (ATP-hydrolyzing) subunit A [Dehalococcoidia bacterium]
MVIETPSDNVRSTKIEEEMRASYLDYAMSVIVARALPDIRDGLKPVQRRILYAMSELGLRPGSQYKKSARIVGEVLGKYHPHGEAPVYEAMVRLAQDFSMRFPLVDGQGNFGSVDNDPPAAMRYTEARLAPIAEETLADIDRDTVDFIPNFDDSLEEPKVLPSRLPNLLVNGAAGIAVGMATNIPPHNLGEVCDAIAYLIDKPEASTSDLTQIVKGPDFPTGGVIFRYERVRKQPSDGQRGQGALYEKQDAIKAAYDGKGRIIMRARTHTEEMAKGGRYQIIITELPYQVNKAALVEKIAALTKGRRIEGIADLRDESDRHGIRVVIELKREGQARQILNSLYKHTAMQSTFAVNMLALVDGQPRTVGLKRILDCFINHRREVIRRRSQFDLQKAQEREHILQGLLVALDHLNQVIQTIRRSESAEKAKERLMRAPYRLSDRQAQAVLDMQLRRLARLERQKIQDEYAEIIKQIAYLEDLLANPRKIDYLIKEETLQVKKKYGDERRTQIVGQEAVDFSEEDLIPHQEMVVTLSARGYIKRVPLEIYRAQGRGGRGKIGVAKREGDPVRHIMVADTHQSLLFFTNRGRVYQVKTYELPDESRQARGIPLINIIYLEQDERVTAVVTTNGSDQEFLVLATELGEVKKTALSEFAAVRRNGLITMDLEPGDALVAAQLARGDDHAILVTAAGQALRFPVKQLRSASRQSGGVRGIRLAKGDRVVGMEVARPNQELLVVSSKGYGKRTTFEEYPTQGRGGLGVRTFTVNEKRGQLVAARTVNAKQQLMIISEDGIVIRTDVDSIAVQGRATMGVTLMGVGPGDTVASIASIELTKRAEEKAVAKSKQAAKKKAPVGRAKAKPSATARGKAAAGKKPTAKKKAPVARAKAKPSSTARGKTATGKKPPAKKKAPVARAKAKPSATVRGKTATGKKPPAKGKTTTKPTAAARGKVSPKQR